MSSQAGTLYVVATPIGNLADLSQRAVDTLRQVALVLAEDTRVSRTLLAHYGVEARLQSYHDHNERQMADKAMAMLLGGHDLALLSDAGTPIVADPGLHLLQRAQDQRVAVRVVPGPSAVTAALSVAGMPAERFVFEGFLPARQAARRRRLQALAAEPRTLVFLETPHRIAACLADMAAAFGAERPGFVGRELTKLFESHYRDALGTLHAHFAAGGEDARGELVLVVAGAEPAAAPEGVATVAADRVLDVLAAALPPGEAARLAARITGEPRNRIYARLRGRD